MRVGRKQISVGEDDKGPIYGFDQHGHPVCGSRKANGQGTCLSRDRRFPSGRCSKHGGHPLSGRPITKGFWSRHLPIYLSGEYDSALLRPDLNSMRDSIAVLDALIAQHLSGLKDCPTENLRKLEDYLAILVGLVEDPEPDTERIRELVLLAKEVSENRITNAEREKQVRQLLRERAELVKAESSRIEKESKYLSVEQVMTVVAALVSIINTHVQQEATRTKIATAIDLLLNKRIIEGDQSGDVTEIYKELPRSSET